MNLKKIISQKLNSKETSNHKQSIELEELKKVPISSSLEPTQNKSYSFFFNQMKNYFRQNLLQIFIIFFEISGVICYAISLKGCNLSQAQCLAKYTINTIYVLLFLLSISSLSYIICLMLVKKKIIKWYHLAGLSLAYLILFFVNFGANLDKHGVFNIIGFLCLDIVFIIVYHILNFFYLIIKKKKYIIFTIIVFIFVLTCGIIIHNSCKNFYKGFGGKEIENDPVYNGCDFPTPKFCLLSRFDNLIDYSRLTFYNCRKD